MLEHAIFSRDSHIIGGVMGIYFGAAWLIYWLCVKSSMARYVLPYKGVVAPFFVFASTIFALTVAMLGNDVWFNHRNNIDAIRLEGKTLISFSEIVLASPGVNADKILLAEKQYITSAIDEEWPLLVERKSAPNTDRAFSNLLRETLAAASDPKIPAVIQGELVKSIDSVTSARTNRLQVREGYSEATRWVCVLLLGLMSLVAVACVHLDQPKPLALSLAIASTVISIILALIGLTVETHSGVVSVSNGPLQDALYAIDGAMLK
jgi:hypothetical protein